MSTKWGSVQKFPAGSGFCVSRNVFKELSQIHINYRSSLLSKGKAGKVYGGKRLPWIEIDRGDNFAPLRSVIGKFISMTQQILSSSTFPARSHWIPNKFTWKSKIKDTRFKQVALYLIRPDGHVSLAADKQWLRALNMYLETFEIMAFGIE